VMAIGANELGAIVAWLNSEHATSTGDGNKAVEWCEARGIDPRALAQFGEEEATAVLEAIAAVEVHVPCGIASAAIAGFQLGLEAERRRRDRGELPAMGGQR
jgi:hypothetical protein